MSENKPPKVVSDPRFLAARKMVGQEGAVDMFATLVEETIAKHGDTGLEAAAVFYEYGNALFRSAVSVKEEEGDAEEEESDNIPKPDDAKAAAAAAAEARLVQQQQQQQEEDDSKPAAAATATATVPTRIEDDDSVDNNNNNEDANNDDQQPLDKITITSTEPPDSHVDDDDIHLALEMMENAYSILEDHLHPDQNEWIQRQLPRILQGLGDVLRELNRMSDAADAYSRALPYREEFVVKLADDTENELQLLKDRRLLVESNVLVAEALLGCAHGQHVVTSETKDMLVTADERVDYARGYYDKARDELQETVLLMGRMAAKTDENSDADFAQEKQNVCFAATLLMGVGETLAAFDEEQQQETAEGKPPAAKKLKT